MAGESLVEMSEEKRNILDVSIAVALIEDLKVKGDISESVMKKIREDAKNMIENNTVP